MILDGPAHAEKGGKVMAQARDLILIPTGYRIDDIKPPIEAAYELEEAGIASEKILFILPRQRFRCRAQLSAQSAPDRSRSRACFYSPGTRGRACRFRSAVSEGSGEGYQRCAAIRR